MVLYILFFICLALIAVFIGSVSYAIAGPGHRTAWTSIVLIEVAVWGFVASTLSFTDGAGPNGTPS